ncbi:MAG: hypothetical protein ACLPIG_02850 [Methylocella sp.]
MMDGAWRNAAMPPRAAEDADEGEQRILAFAPDQIVANSDYRGPALGLYRLARRQSGFQQSVQEFAGWAASESSFDRQKATLLYVLDGRHGSLFGTKLADRRPSWLPETPEGLRDTPLVLDLPRVELANLLSILYPRENATIWEAKLPLPTISTPGVDPADFVEQAYDWWVKVHQKERQRHDQTAYPDDFRPSILREVEAADNREGWFTFFALGIFRAIRRAHVGAHRNLIAAAMQKGWSAEMSSARLPDNPRPSISRLEDFARADAWRIDYPQWRRALADLYVFARWLPEYVDAFRNLPTLIRQNGNIALSDAWRLSASPLWQRRGLEGAPLTQSLGPGTNWLIREAIRRRLWPESDALPLFPYGWAATARLRRLFVEDLRFSLGDKADMDLAPVIFDFVRNHLTDGAAVLRDLDLPLQTLAEGQFSFSACGGRSKRRTIIRRMIW